MSRSAYNCKELKTIFLISNRINCFQYMNFFTVLQVLQTTLIAICFTALKKT